MGGAVRTTDCFLPIGSPILSTGQLVYPQPTFLTRLHEGAFRDLWAELNPSRPCQFLYLADFDREPAILLHDFQQCLVKQFETAALAWQQMDRAENREALSLFLKISNGKSELKLK